MTPVAVVAGCLFNVHGEVLVAQRPAHKGYPGQWEFPGGKVESGEGAAQALARELREELGITVRNCRPLIRFRHDYPELSVELDVWRVTSYDGTVRSHEHPTLAWVAPARLVGLPLLAADRPIVTALRLPPHYAFTPPASTAQRLLERLARLPAGSLLRLRLPQLDDAAYARLAARLVPIASALGLRVLLDRAPAQAAAVGAAGWHASARALRALRRRPVPETLWFGASVHSREELAQALRLGADFAVLGPVKSTASHPGTAGLGWAAFAAIRDGLALPVYAIGGLGPPDLQDAWRRGAQGVAGISAYWSSSAAGDVSDSSATGSE